MDKFLRLIKDADEINRDFEYATTMAKSMILSQPAFFAKSNKFIVDISDIRKKVMRRQDENEKT